MGRFILLLVCLVSQAAWAASTATTNVFHHAQKGDSFEVERWIRKGGNPSYVYFSKGENAMQHDKRYTPVHAALAWAGGDPVDVIRVLLKYDADIEYFADVNLRYATKDSYGIPPLYRAVSRDQVESARALIRAGAKTRYDYRRFDEPELAKGDPFDPDVVFADSRKMQQWKARAALTSYVESAEMATMLSQENAISMVELGALLAQGKPYGRELAAKLGVSPFATGKIYGVDPGYVALVGEFLQELDGYNRKSGSLSEEDRQLLASLNKMKAGLAKELLLAVDESGCSLSEDLFVEGGVKLNLLIIVAESGGPVCYQYFQRKGLGWPDDVKAVGAGPLHVAVRFNNSNLAKWLIEQDPGLLDSKDNEGRRPLLYSQNEGMVRFLLQNGATPPEAWKD